MNEKDIKRIIEMTEEERKVCLEAAKKRLHRNFGITLTKDQIHDYCVFRLVSNHFRLSMDEFLISQGAGNITKDNSNSQSEETREKIEHVRRSYKKIKQAKINKT